ncbi:MAG: energy-coupling factor transporter transmembrane component T family protein [Desulfocucumaceae bacterium]
MELGQYLPVDSMVHRLDPRTKILSALLAITAVLASGWAGLAASAVLAGAGLTLGRVTLPVLWRQARSLGFIIVVTVLLQVLFTPGNELLRAGPVHISVRGLLAGLDLAARLVLIIALGIVLTSTTSTLRLAAGLEELLKPLARLGVPVHEVVMAVTVAVRFVPVIFEEARTIMNAQVSRGAGFGGPGLARRATAFISLMVPLLVAALRRSEELATAMEARCYQGGRRTRMNVLKFSTGDAVCMLFCLFVLTCALVFRGTLP